ncbi:hypothetical protein E2C01_071505 [Portunus trituberculatus]|uniref:Uncharacterized protein n=1 Tax=Portunus trituberculatus TaxID=210409 RepID=A0A5B7HVI3_PORTR|nr:hypothetical protein [Portunus trituberculatus]
MVVYVAYREEMGVVPDWARRWHSSEALVHTYVGRGDPHHPAKLPHCPRKRHRHRLFAGNIFFFLFFIFFFFVFFQDCLSFLPHCLFFFF